MLGLRVEREDNVGRLRIQIVDLDHMDEREFGKSDGILALERLELELDPGLLLVPRRMHLVGWNVVALLDHVRHRNFP